MNVLLFLGSRRQSSPPNPARLGERVCSFLSTQAASRFEVTVIDPLDYPLAAVFKPSFAYSNKSVPDYLAQLQDLIQQADAYVMLSPEYNHSMSPALSDLLNHFPGSAFSFKPSLIATYSSGQWGGTRAAVNMRTFLSELGCLPVSTMLHFPHADQIFNKEGELSADQDVARWQAYANRGVEQLHWWATAAKQQRQACDPFKAPPAFQTTPKERDAN